MKNKQGLMGWESKDKVEVGVDECARGCLLGRTYTAAVIWSPEFLEEAEEAEEYDWIHKIKDSKKLSIKVREILSEQIKSHCLDYAIMWADEKTIDQKNILQAVQGCFHESLDSLQLIPDKIFVDGTIFNSYYDKDFNLIPHVCVVKGDNTYLNIASASILAKVAHDKYIKELCEAHPQLSEKYDISNNMGYGTASHLKGIETHGITDFHRKTFGICKTF